VSSLGELPIEVRLVPYGKSGFNAKLVYHGLESALGRKGISFRSVETRENGAGTTLANRVGVDGWLDGRFPATVEVELVPNTHGKFTHKLVMRGLAAQLHDAGLTVHNLESSRFGRGEEMAIRVNPQGRIPRD